MYGKRKDGPRGGRGAGHALLCLVFLLAVALHGACHAGKAAEHVDYGREENWAYFEQDASGKAVDVFFVCPTVFRGDEGHWNMELSDGETRRKFLGATNMEKGIYDRCARFFAPYYRMAGFASHGLSKEGRENCLTINPLSWRTDNEAADKAWNFGACFTGYDGEIKREIPALTGAYIAPGRGTLKATDINPEDYPPRLSDYPQGVYHIYDYQFFYRNLQENVALRVAAWQKSHAGESSGEAFSDRLEMREGPQSTESRISGNAA